MRAGRPQAMKHCPRCNEVMPLSSFHRNASKPDGRQSVCRTCRTSYVRSWNRRNPERSRAAGRKWTENNLSKVREYKKKYVRAYYKTESGKLKKSLLNKKYREANPQKIKAHGLLRSATKAGRVKRPSICSKCGQTGKINGHHEDYSKPLDVIWLYQICHSHLHLKQGQAA